MTGPSPTDPRVTTSHWGAFKVHTDNDRIVAVDAFDEDPHPSAIARSIPAAVHHKTRVSRPSIRRGWLEGGAGRSRERRGEDEFIELPWDEALDITAAEIARVCKLHGNGAIFGGSYGWASAGRFHNASGQLHRFLNANGGYVAAKASYSTAAAQAIIPHVLGMDFLKLTWAEQNSWPIIAEHTQMLVMFGGINPKNSQVSMGGVTRHETTGWLQSFANDGMALVNISPQRADAPAQSQWMPVIPGSDTALMLGIAYVLENEGFCNEDFLANYTVGYEKFRAYLMGESDNEAKTPEWAQSLCGIDANAIRELARGMASKRTLITVSWSLQRAQHGEQPFWMATTLAAMLGQIGLPGGGIGYGYGAIGGVGVAVKHLNGMTLSRGKNAITDFIPVARIADMLLQPGASYQFNGESREYPDIHLVYWCGGNPFHHHQDLNRLDQAWKQPDTIIVHEPWWTATAKRADIVLPATTPYEREDVGCTLSDSWLFHMPALIPPVGEARDDFAIFAALSRRLDTFADFTEGRDSAGWIRFLYQEFIDTQRKAGVELPSFDELCSRNYTELPITGGDYAKTAFSAFRADPIAAPLGTPSGKIEIFSETIAGFGYSTVPGHPSWQTPDEWLGTSSSKPGFPLHLVSPQPADKLHSQLEPALADEPGARPAVMLISRTDAGQRGIKQSDIVRVFNHRGVCLARAALTDEIRDGVVALPTGAWLDQRDDGVDTQGNPNVLTRDLGTSPLGQGCSAHTTLVDVELVPL